MMNKSRHSTNWKGRSLKMKINWKVRIKNKSFWLALVPAILLLAQVVAVPFGYKFDIDLINKQLLDIVNAAFGVLTIVGVVADPTTAGITDKETIKQ